mgnify:CR=1 FL=1
MKPDIERFFRKDEKHINSYGKEVVEKDVIFFEFYKNQKLGDPVDLVCRASDEHFKRFPAAYKAFSESELVVEVIPEVVEEVQEVLPEPLAEEPVKKSRKKV